MTVVYMYGNRMPQYYIIQTNDTMSFIDPVSAAHELRAWLIHYSPVCLHGILPDEYYQHHLLLVEGVYLLLKDLVSAEDILQSTRLLRHYCFMFDVLYGMYT